ncbi:hypothetical protein ACKKBG_A30155 [Auxenochlorella protothecoides x Auxenochlorella symbiontica]
MEAIQRKLTDQVRSIQEALHSGSSPKVVSELVEDLGTRARILQSMRGDLDILHRRLKSMRQQLQTRHPWAFEADAGTTRGSPGPATLAALDAESAVQAVNAWGREAVWAWK